MDFRNVLRKFCAKTSDPIWQNILYMEKGQGMHSQDYAMRRMTCLSTANSAQASLRQFVSNEN